MSSFDLEPDDDELVEPLPVRVKRALSAEVWLGWWVGAPCASADPDAWFPDVFAVEQVVRTCQECPLRRPCLAAGILRNEHGIWGATSRVQRTRARRHLADGQPIPVVLDALLRSEAPSSADGHAGYGAAA